MRYNLSMKYLRQVSSTNPLCAYTYLNYLKLVYIKDNLYISYLELGKPIFTNIALAQ